MPDFLSDFEGVTLISNAAPPAGEESLFDDVNLQSEVGINSDNYPKLEIIEAALTAAARWTRSWTTGTPSGATHRKRSAWT